MRALLVNAMLLCLPFLVLVRPHVGVLGYYWVSIMAPQATIWGGLQIGWAQFIAIATLGSWIISNEKKTVPMEGATVALLVMFAWTAITTVFALFPDAATEQLIEWAKVVLMVLLTTTMFQSKDRIHALLWIFVLSAGYYMFWSGLAQPLRGWSLTAPHETPFSSENPFARICLISLPIIYFLYKHSGHIVVRYGFLAGLMLTLIALIGSGSRGGLAALFVIWCISWWRSKHKIGYLIVAGVLAFGLYNGLDTQEVERYEALKDPTEESSAQARFQAWEYNFNLAVRRPIFGGGFNAYLGNYVEERGYTRAPHSNYFQVMGEHGFVGFAMYLAFCTLIYLTAGKVKKMARGKPEYKWYYDLGDMLQISFLAYLVGGLTINQAFWEPAYVIAALVICTKLALQKEMAGEEDERSLVPNWVRRPVQVARQLSKPH